MKRGRDFLYQLLPQILRDQEDDAVGARRPPHQLRALLAVLQTEHDALERSVDQLYEDWFIETCDEWVVPYIGDLVGVSVLPSAVRQSLTMRPLVANAIRYRRRKGTANILPRVAADATGWKALSVDYRSFVARTQHMRNARPGEGGTFALRRARRDKLDLTASYARTPDVKGPAGRHARSPNVPLAASGDVNLDKIGLYLWRLQAYPVTLGRALEVAVAGKTRQCFTLHPFGVDMPLFCPAEREDDLERSWDEKHVPAPFTPARLLREWKRVREAFDEASPSVVSWGVFRADAVFVVRLVTRGEGGSYEVDERWKAAWPQQLRCADLGGSAPGRDWEPRPHDGWHDVPEPPGSGEGTPRLVHVDPARGRLHFSEPLPAGCEVYCDYYHGGCGDLGGAGSEALSRASSSSDESTWRCLVSRPRPETTLAQEAAGLEFRHRPGRESVDEVRAVSLSDAVREWHRERDLPSRPPEQVDVSMPLGPSRESAWNAIFSISSSENEEIGDDGAMTLDLRADRVAIEGLSGHTCLRGRLIVDGRRGARLRLSGLMLDGSIEVRGHCQLEIQDCTVRNAHGPAVRASGSVEDGDDDTTMNVAIRRSIVGPIDLPDHSSLFVSDSVVDGMLSPGAAITGSDVAITAGEAALVRSTVLGAVDLDRLPMASSVIFTGRVIVARRAHGEIRYSYAPEGSSLPLRRHCQPESPLAGSDAEPGRRVEPRFTTVEYGQPGYGQLARNCPPEISAGGENGAEMGAFHRLRQPQREAALMKVLDEYMPLGVDARVHFVT